MIAIGNGGVYHRGFGIKKRSWFGGRSRPAFMEPLGVPPPATGTTFDWLGVVRGFRPPVTDMNEVSW